MSQQWGRAFFGAWLRLRTFLFAEKYKTRAPRQSSLKIFGGVVVNCKHCGKEIDQDSTFCRFCGSKISEEEKIDSTSLKRKSKKKLAVICSSIALLAVVITVICIVSSQSSPSPSSDSFSAGSSAAAESEPSYIASVNGKKYHKLDCRFVEQINDENKVFYHSESEAEEDGKEPCKTCKP